MQIFLWLRSTWTTWSIILAWTCTCTVRQESAARPQWPSSTSASSSEWSSGRTHTTWPNLWKHFMSTAAQTCELSSEWSKPILSSSGNRLISITNLNCLKITTVASQMRLCPSSTSHRWLIRLRPRRTSTCRTRPQSLAPLTSKRISLEPHPRRWYQKTTRDQ